MRNPPPDPGPLGAPGGPLDAAHVLCTASDVLIVLAALAVPAFLVARAAWRDRAFRRGLANVAVFVAACGSAQLLRTVPLAAPDSLADAVVKFAAAVVACGAAAVLVRGLARARTPGGDPVPLRPTEDPARALRESEGQFRRMFEDSPIGIYRATPDGRVVVANPAALAMIECRSADAFSECRPGDKDFPDAPAGGPPDGPTRSEFSWQRPDGTVITVRETVRPVRGPEGTVRYYEATLDDVTDRRKAEDQLRERETLLRNVIAHIPCAVFWKDRNSVYLGCNDRFAQDQGFGSPADVIGRTDRDLPFGPIGVSDERAADLQVIESGLPVLHREETHTRARGDATLLMSKVPLWNHAGALVGVLGTYLDITERKRLEEQFREAQKMEAVGRLASGIAHEFNNLLAAIRGNVDVVRALLGANSVFADRLDDVRNASDRAAGLVRRLLTFGRREPIRPEILDLNEVVSALTGMLGRWFGGGIAIATELSPEGVRVRADRGHLEQVVLNLAANAREAMPGGGTLTLATELIREPHGGPRPPAEPATELVRGFDAAGTGAAAVVRLSVTDTGCGMTDEVKARAFEPFFSTKGPEPGAGLGLATVYGIVQRVGGRIRVVSVPGRGTAVHVDLPLCDAPIGDPIRSGAPAAGRSVLLVEDEDAVRALARIALESQGFAVTEAPDAGTALAGLDPDRPLDLLVTGLTMPGMDGQELAEAVRLGRPQIGVVFMSGYVPESRSLDRFPGAVVLPKPFTPSQLLDGAGRALGSAHAPRAEILAHS